MTPTNEANARSGRLAAQVERILEARPVRILLSAAIVASLVPDFEAPWPMAWFATLFAAEFVARGFVLWDTRRRGVDGGVGIGAWGLLVLDFLALLSFAPVPATWQEARWLRVFRLSRMLLLAGYWAPLARDLWVIVSRRERWQQVIWMGVAVALLSFAGATLIFHLGDGEVDFDGDGRITAHDRGFFNLLWWSFRQIQDPGNMIASPRSVAALVVSLVLTVFGLFLVSFLIGLGTDVVRELLELGRVRPPGLAAHTVIVNVDSRIEELLRELFRFYRKSEGLRRALRSPSRLHRLWDGLRGTVGPDFVVTGKTAEEPEFLKDRDFRRVIYRAATEREQDFLERVDGHRARRLLLLADHEREDADARTVETLFFLASALDAEDPGHDGSRLLLAEVLDEAHVAAAETAVARARTVRGITVPSERLIGLFWATCLREPGAGRLLVELLTSHGREIYTVIFDARALSFRVSRPPWLPADPVAAMGPFVEHALSLPKRPVAPLALLCGRPGDEAYGHLDVYFGGGETPAAPVRGIVVVADNVAGARALATDERSEAPPPPASVWPLDVAPSAGLGDASGTGRPRVVVFGFRRSTAHMVADLLRAEPAASLTVVVGDEQEADGVRRALGAHALSCSLSGASHESGVFEVAATTIRYRCRHGEGTVEIAVADRTAVADPTFLDDLPGGLGSVCEVDAVCFVADPSGAADARITATVFEILTLATARRLVPPRLLVEVSETDLANRLAADLFARFPDVPDRVEVHAYDALRSFLLFQSVVVPGFDAIYTRILSSRGHRLRRVVPRAQPPASIAFPDLVRSCAARGLRLIAVEEGDGPTDPHRTLHVAPLPNDPGYAVYPGRLAALWVVMPEDGAARLESEGASPGP
ncbi:MAG: hypothetical protein D6705_04825 [Deltaproteobacteria bacterium]|nr:MAG: hypothetical protein D6705_04825 [Deltaproteobacteria bacterium]